MNSFLAMLWSNIKMSVRNRQAIFWNLVFPALFIVLFGSIWNGDNFNTYSIGIAGPDSGVKTAFVDAVQSQSNITVSVGDQAEELGELENDDRDLVVVFPEDDGGAITIYSASSQGDTSTQIALSATKSILMDVVGTSAGMPIDEVEIDTLGVSFVDWFMPGIIAMSLMNTGIIGISTAFVAFREKGILRRIKVTPFPLWKFLVARVLGAMVVGLASTLILIGLSMVLFNATIRGNLFLVLAVIVLVSTCMLSIGAGIAAVARNVETAAGLANMLTFPMMFLSGVFFPIDSMPDWMRPIMAVMPLRYGVEALRETMLYGRGIDAIWTQSLILLAVSVVAIAIAVRFFKWDATPK